MQINAAHFTIDYHRGSQKAVTPVSDGPSWQVENVHPTLCKRTKLTLNGCDQEPVHSSFTVYCARTRGTDARPLLCTSVNINRSSVPCDSLVMERSDGADAIFLERS